MTFKSSSDVVKDFSHAISFTLSLATCSTPKTRSLAYECNMHIFCGRSLVYESTLDNGENKWVLDIHIIVDICMNVCVNIQHAVDLQVFIDKVGGEVMPVSFCLCVYLGSLTSRIIFVQGLLCTIQLKLRIYINPLHIKLLGVMYSSESNQP